MAVEQPVAQPPVPEQPVAEQPVVEPRAEIARVGDVQVEPQRDGYSVTIRLNASPPDADWVKLFEHPPVLLLLPPARRPTISDATIEIVVRNEEQMNASVRYAELAVAEANQVYNDEVLPRRERHRQIRDAARSRDEVGLDAMARAANAL
jgi:hypothetical protein